MSPAYGLLILAGVLAVIVLTLEEAFPAASEPIVEPTGLPCDLPLLEQGDCMQFEERWRFDPAEQTPLTPGQRPFTRIEQPNDLADIWSSTASLSVAVAITLAGLSMIWRRELDDFEPMPGTLFGIRSTASLGVKSSAGWVVALLPVGAAMWFGGGAFLDEAWVEGTVLVVLWLSAAPSLVAVVDCATIAVDTETRGEERGENGDANSWSPAMIRHRELIHLQGLHERFIGTLGVILALFVLWLAIDSQLRAANLVAEVARQRGTFLVEPTEAGRVLFWGALLTGLLIVAYAPTTLAIRDAGTAFVDESTRGLPWDLDFSKAQQERSARLNALGLDQPLHSRFRNALAVAAPLLTSLGTSFVSF